MAARSSNAVKRFNTLMEELRTIVESGAGPAVVLESRAGAYGLPRRAPGVHRPAGRDPDRDLQELAAVALEFEQERGDEEGAGTLAEFLEKVALVADSDQITDEEEDGSGVITLMTLHTAKGLEFPVVFLTGLERRLPAHARPRPDQGAGGGAPPRLRRHHPRPRTALPRPAPRCAAPGGSRRTTRLAVPGEGDPGTAPGLAAARRGRWPRPPAPTSGITSSLSSSRSRSGPSGFATRRGAEKPTVALAVGDRVTHDQFGLGTVTAVEGHGDQAKATVDFGDERPSAPAVRAGREAAGRPGRRRGEGREALPLLPCVRSPCRAPLRRGRGPCRAAAPAGRSPSRRRAGLRSGDAGR
ncbi:DNA helicase PcrA [Streptomyces californicus]